MAGKKGNDASVLQRASIIQELLLQGYSRRDIINYVKNNTTWGVSETQIDRYIKKANQFILEDVQKFGGAEFEKAILRLEMLFRRNFEAERYRDALDVQKELNKVLDLYTRAKDDNADDDLNININFVRPEDV